MKFFLLGIHRMWGLKLSMELKKCVVSSFCDSDKKEGIDIKEII
jgi:hypothetical protein